MAEKQIKQIKQYVTIFLDESLFGIDIRAVNEVNPCQCITPAPLTDPCIAGLVNIRGQVVLIIDISVIFGREKRKITDNSHIVILKTKQDLARVTSGDSDLVIQNFSDKPIGLLADRIGDVVSVEEHRVKSSSRLARTGDAPFLKGIVDLEESILAIINPEKILTYTQEESSLVEEKW